MNPFKVPCRYCQSRHEGCHGTCEEYKSYSEEVKKFREQRLSQHDVNDYYHQSIGKTEKYKFRHRSR